MFAGGLGGALALLLVLAVAAQPEGVEAATQAEVRQRVERILATPGFQAELPEEGAAEPEPPEEDLPAWLGSLLVVLLWGGAAAAVFLLVYAAIDGLRRRSAPTPTAVAPRAPASPTTAAPALPASLPDAEALAGQGRFGEAVHALLLQALVALARRRGTAFPASLTSREVLSRSGLDGGGEEALAELVAAVERFLFAGRPLEAGDWERCRRAFVDLEAAAGGAV